MPHIRLEQIVEHTIRALQTVWACDGHKLTYISRRAPGIIRVELDNGQIFEFTGRECTLFNV